VDGEGTFAIVRDPRRNRLLIRAHAYNTIPEPLLKIQSMFGSTVRPVARKVRKEIERPGFVWTISNTKAIEVAEMLMPYLTVKRPHAEILHEFRITIEHRDRTNPVGVPLRELPDVVRSYQHKLRDRLSDLSRRSYALDGEVFVQKNPQSPNGEAA
jgi:hypothetical protein